MSRKEANRGDAARLLLEGWMKFRDEFFDLSLKFLKGERLEDKIVASGLEAAVYALTHGAFCRST